MKTKPLCPILLIGFAPPEEGKRDIRRCSTECAWHDDQLDQCVLKTISNTLDDIGSLSQDHLDYLLDMSAGILYEDENYDYDPNTPGS